MENLREMRRPSENPEYRRERHRNGTNLIFTLYYDYSWSGGKRGKKWKHKNRVQFLHLSKKKDTVGKSEKFHVLLLRDRDGNFVVSILFQWTQFSWYFASTITLVIFFYSPRSRSSFMRTDLSFSMVLIFPLYLLNSARNRLFCATCGRDRYAHMAEHYWSHCFPLRPKEWSIFMY